MEIHAEGNDPWMLVLTAVFMASRLGLVFVFPAGILSLIVSILALRKKLTGIFLLFLINPLVILIGSIFWYLSLSGENDWSMVTSVCRWILSIAMLMPLVLALFLLKKIAVNLPVDSAVLKKRANNSEQK